MALTDTAIRNAKPTEKPQRKSDGGGLSLLLMPTGSKLWRLAYRFAGKQKMLAVGAYPVVTLGMARAARDDAKRLLAQGVDPSEKRKADRRAAAAARTFSIVADEWFTVKMVREYRADKTLKKVRWIVGLLASDIGHRPIEKIEPPELLSVLRKIAARGHHETVSRMRSVASQIFRFGIASGYCTRDPSADLRGALTSPTVKHRPAITNPTRLGELLRAIDAYPTATTRIALTLLSLTASRPGEVAKAEWHEFDLDDAVWSLPAHRMKQREAHRVALSQQAITALRELQPITGSGRFLFPNVNKASRWMSENTLNLALRRMGFAAEEMVAHGFRSTFSTLLNETGRWNPDVIEKALAHVEANEVRRAYNRARYWPERVRLMQHWADQLDQLRERGRVFILETKSEEALQAG